MCTLVILRRPKHDWPILIGANRDEMRDRASLPPSRHWDDQTHIIAGKDAFAGGTWLALNQDRLIAAVLNRRDSLGPGLDKRSRGELPLEACNHAEAREACRALALLEPTSFRSFNIVVADTREAFWVKSNGLNITTSPIPEGLSMITSQDLNSTTNSSRIRFHLKRFRQAPYPAPEKKEWDIWKALLSSRDKEPGSSFRGAMNVETDYGFGTVSSSLLALPNANRTTLDPQWLYCSSQPDEGSYHHVEI